VTVLPFIFSLIVPEVAVPPELSASTLKAPQTAEVSPGESIDFGKVMRPRISPFGS
jgi:hypothetical protein